MQHATNCVQLTLIDDGQPPECKHERVPLDSWRAALQHDHALDHTIKRVASHELQLAAIKGTGPRTFLFVRTGVRWALIPGIMGSQILQDPFFYHQPSRFAVAHT
jgi:hypothetical protein